MKKVKSMKQITVIFLCFALIMGLLVLANQSVHAEGTVVGLSLIHI